MKKRFIATLLTTAMVASMLSACGDSGTFSPIGTPSVPTDTTAATESAASDSSDDVVRLQILDMPANQSGVITGWFMDYIKDQVGVELDFLPTGDQGEQKLQALMASGELPDIVVFKDDKQVINAVAGDMLLAYDDYKDLVPNLYNNAATSLQYYADNMSNGQGKAYAVGVELKNAVEQSGNNGGLSVRYDVYKEIGSPKADKMEDWLPIIQKMQEAYPTNDDGQKVYGISLFGDWDRSYMTLGMFFSPYVGANIGNEATLAQVDYTDNEKISSILEDGTGYMRFLNFMFQANQMGLVDPDSMTQRFSDYTQKATDGRILFGIGDWGTTFTKEQQEKGEGFRYIATENEKILLSPIQETGKGWSVSVSKATKYPEKAMALVNLLYDYETAMTEQNGLRGQAWDLDENNQPYITEEGYKDWVANADQMGKEKGYNVFRAFTGESINKDIGCPISYAYWKKPDYAPADTKLVADWKADYGFDSVLEYEYSNGNVIVRNFVPQPTLNDEMEQISARVGDVIKTYSWKMIFAKDQAEYDSLCQEMRQKADDLGINDFVDWYKESYETNKAFAEKYINEN